MKLFSFDTETHLRQPGLAAPPVVCGSFAGEDVVGLLDAREALEWFWAHIRTERIVGQYLVFDLGVVCAADPRLVDEVFKALDEERLHSIDIREALIDLERGQFGIDPRTGRKLDEDNDEGARYSLELLVDRYLGLDISDEKNAPDAWRRRYALLEPKPVAEWPWAARRYPLRDAAFTRDVKLAQDEVAATMPNGGNLHDEASQLRAAWALHLMTLWGIRTNGDRVAALKAKVEADHAKALEEFKAHGIVRPDGTENKARLAELVTAAYHGDPPRTPKGAVSTDRDTKLESGDELLIRHGTAGKGNKYRTTYLPKVEQGTDRPINPTFNVIVSTLRTSSDYQQLPQKGGIRECHEARPGFVYCSVDYGGLELRTMSQRAIWDLGWSKMADTLNTGKDCHTLAAAEFLGVTYDELLPRVKAKEEIADSFRKVGKVYNFGAGGGLGGGGMAYNARAKENIRFCLSTKVCEKCGVNGFVQVMVRGQPKRVCAVCVDVAKKLKRQWMQAWPEQQELADRAGEATSGDRRVTVTIPVANVVRAGCGYSQFLNNPFQGLGAIVCKLAMWRVQREMYTDRRSPLWGSRTCLMVHDELVTELRTDDGWQRTHDAAERQAHIMREAARELMPDLAPAIEAEPALSRVLSKDAQTLRDSKGILQVWEGKKAA